MQNSSHPYYLIPISAKTEEALSEKLSDMYQWIKKNRENASIKNVAFTLLVARNHFAKRAVFLAASLEELLSCIEMVLDGQEPKYFLKSEEEIDTKKLDKSFVQKGNLLMQQMATEPSKDSEKFSQNLEKLANLYVKGYNLKWSILYAGSDCMKISLPTYPFSMERYWISDGRKKKKEISSSEMNQYPFISNNVSTFYEECLKKVFTKDEFYIKDHVVGGEYVLPGVAYLEMVREAIEIALEEDVTVGFRNVKWLIPIRLTEKMEEMEVRIGLEPVEESEILKPLFERYADVIQYEIYSINDLHMKIVHGKGLVLISENKERQENCVIDVKTFIKNAPGKIDGAACYADFLKGGLDLRQSFQAIQSIYTNAGEAVSCLTLPKFLEKNRNKYFLHPSLVDGALETAISLLSESQQQEDFILLPESISEVNVFGEIPNSCYSYVRESEESKKSETGDKIYDVSIVDEENKTCLEVKGFTLKKTHIEKKDNKAATCYFKSTWMESPIEERKQEKLSGVIIFDQDDIFYKKAVEHNYINQNNTVLVTNSTDFKKADANHYCINLASEEDFQLLFASLAHSQFELNYVFYRISQDGRCLDMNQAIADGFYSSALFLKNCDGKHKIHYICMERAEEGIVNPVYDGVSGLLKTVSLENKNFITKKVVYDNISLEKQLETAFLEVSESTYQEVKYENGKRFVKVNQALSLKDGANGLKADKNYVITGGFGGLGLIFADYLANKVGAHVMLCSRRTLNPSEQKKLAALNQSGQKVSYYQMDVTNQEDVKEGLEKIRQEHGTIHGIIHCAGSQKDGMLAWKKTEDMKLVIEPKVKGMFYFDEYTKNDALDFFILCSSIAAVNGNIGQADYAYANSVMDSFAAYRTNLVNKKERSGKTCSINWSLWKNGGMGVSEKTEKMFEEVLGLQPLSNEIGIETLNLALSNEETNVQVYYGDKKKIEAGLKAVKEKNPEVRNDSVAAKNEQNLKEKVQGALVDIVKSILRINESSISLNRDMSDYGFNSITLTDYTDAINDLYSTDVTPANYFENPTINSFVDFLLKHYGKEIEDYYKESTLEEVKEEKELIEEEKKQEKKKKINRFRRSMSIEENATQKNQHQDIAIIGLDCRMPGAKDAQEYWKNLLDCKDSIVEVPADRWDWKSVKSDPDKGGKKEVSHWGGFMDRVDSFDAMFFGISPREAEKMDPQQRIFMETVWKTIEDAGYRASDFAGSNMGIFAGVATEDYSDLTRENATDIEAYSTMGLSHCILVNRISYYFNWHGPSEPIDTACSSSLVAIHRAVQSIINGDCDTAIAGGINVMSSPTLHISFSKGGMLAEDGRCKTFDKKADGYVRGEGTGAVLLKPLDKAVKDHDHIYAVIKGTAINHGGHANSLTAPNPNAQCAVLKAAYENANIKTDRVSYIEAHGTGTSLGDPIEINALKMAFDSENNNKEAYCGIGAVKTNIGHLEAAAGIAGIIKVTLALKNKKLPGLVHFHELNPYIKLKHSPFYLVERTKDWEETVDENGKVLPRVAGVSSFGFGGVNAHIVLEEYMEQSKRTIEKESEDRVIVFSAKSENSLNQELIQMKEQLLQPSFTEHVRFEDIAYTLQLGREAMDYRTAVICNSCESLLNKIDGILAGENTVGVYKGFVHTIGNFNVEEEDSQITAEMRNWVNHKQLEVIAERFVSGKPLAWKVFYENKNVKRISLPTYSFEKERHWIKIVDEEDRTSALMVKGTSSAHYNLKPIIDENKSTLFEQKFTKILSMKDPYLKDHVVFGKNLLPGVAYVEMVCEAGALAGERPVKEISDIVWIQPIILEQEEIEITISIMPKGSLYAYKVYSLNGAEKTVYSMGNISYEESEKPVVSLDTEKIIKRCDLVRNKKECYTSLYKKVGFLYGEYFQVTQMLYGNDTEVFAELKINDKYKDTLGDYILHPALFDGSIRAIAGRNNIKNQVLHIPFSLGDLKIYGGFTERCYSYARLQDNSKDSQSGSMKFDITIFNDKKEVILTLKDFMARPYKEKDILYYTPEWEEIKVDDAEKQEHSSHNYFILCSSLKEGNSLKSRLQDSSKQYEGKLHLIIYNETYDKDGDNYYLSFDKEEQWNQIWETSGLGKGQKVTIINELPLTFSSVELNDTKNPGQLDKEIEQYLDSGIYVSIGLCKSLIACDEIEKAEIVMLYPNKLAPYYEILNGFAKSIGAVSRKINITNIGMNGNQKMDYQILASLFEHTMFHNGSELKIQDGKVQTRRIVSLNRPKELGSEEPVRKNGVYILTGGTGGLGHIFAEYLAEMYQASIVLAGRKESSSEIEKQIKDLEAFGSKVIYVKTNLENYAETEHLIRKTKDMFGCINGIIHMAGFGIDTPLTESGKDVFKKVFQPKLYGTINLDYATRNEKLDFFFFFSSVSVELGDMGACSYATANSFLDRYAEYRKALVEEGRRSGKTVSVNWPLWKDGGIQLKEEDAKFFHSYSGMQIMEAQNGLKIFEEVLKIGTSQIIPAIGTQARIEKALKVESKSDSKQEEITQTAEQSNVSHEQIFNQTETYLKELLSKVTEIPVQKINPTAQLEQYGIDSMLIMELNKLLERDFELLPKTLFFEYQTLEQLTNYFVSEHRDRLKQILSIEETEKPSDLEEAAPAVQKNRFKTTVISQTQNQEVEKTFNDDIAVIGISGRYPKAYDLDEFWNNLKNGLDCITEIPADRWDKNQYFAEQKGKPGTIYSKWGGFIDDVDKFDPLFFNISPREADYLDPQERLFMENAWHTMEDAGYCTKTIGGTNTGVFVGVMYGNYQLFGAEESLKGNVMTTNSSYASIANRVSYYLNLSGPSMAIDTMCSSSLTAIHLACESIRRGESEMAFAGGVNVSVHPDKYLFLCRQNFLSSEGKCRSFGEGGDGYVPGEGVGSVLLKPLKKAVEDGDHIYAVIKGSGINHGGKTNGYSVPNPNAQEKVIENVLEKCKIDPATINYVEAHGTGTALGDPIEITGLSKAFGKGAGEKHSCAIGSVKSNVGHLESAAGIAAITKVILQMQHKMLVPSIHADTLNTNINFQDSLFYVQRELAPWKNTVAFRNGVEESCPRRAGVSSFGAGGTNVHIIMEEYLEPEQDTAVEAAAPQLIVFSAKNKQRLKEVLSLAAEYAKDRITKKEAVDFEAVAYTLQIGRDALPERISFVAHSLADMLIQIERILGTEKGSFEGNVYQGNILDNDETVGKLSENEYKDLEKIASIWVKGGEIEWNLLHQGRKLKKVSLPTYPFAKEHYWYPKSEDSIEKKSEVKVVNALHPLVDRNISTIYEEKFEKILRTEEFFIKDHVIGEKTLLPGVAYLEMVREAGSVAANEEVKVIKNVAWINSINMDHGDKKIDICLQPNEDNIHVLVKGTGEEAKVTFFEGTMILESQLNQAITERHYDLSELGRNMVKRKTRKDCYQGLYKQIGFNYGPGFQVTDEVLIGEDSVLAKLTIPEHLKASMENFLLHPSLLDGAVRAIAMIDEENKQTHVPFGIKNMTIFKPLTSCVYSYARVVEDLESTEKENISFDIEVLDEKGEELVRIEGFSVRPFGKKIENVRLVPKWLEQQLETKNVDNDSSMLVIGTKEWSADIESIAASKIFGQVYTETVNSDFGEVFAKIASEMKDRLNIVVLCTGMERESSAVVDLAKQYIYMAKRLIKAYTEQIDGKNVKCLFVNPLYEGKTMPAFEALSGVTKSISSVNAKFESALLECSKNSSKTQLFENILEELGSREIFQGRNIRRIDEKRYVRRLVELDTKEILSKKQVSFREHGIYMITGGLGKLGMLYAEELAKNYKAKIALVGRKEHADSKKRIEQLQALGGEAEFYSCNLENIQDTADMTAQIEKDFGKINGIIHCAGVMDTTIVTEADDKKFESVLVPKINGLASIDEATKELALDFILVFSSVSSELGDMGACSYAAANSFMDRYACMRNEAAALGQRKGKTIAVNWPLWKDGGMELTDDYTTFYNNYLGMEFMTKEEGIKLLPELLQSESSQIIPAAGNRKKILSSFHALSKGSDVESKSKNNSETQSAVIDEKSALFKQTEQYLKGIISEILHVPEEEIHSKEELSSFGIDSVVGLEIINEFDKNFADLPRTLFFEFNDINSLAKYFVTQYRSELEDLFQLKEEIRQPEETVEVKTENVIETKQFSRFVTRTRQEEKAVRPAEHTGSKDIAIIGINGKYPMANDLDIFWKNLKEGKDCITEIPISRWDYRDGYNPKKGILGKYYSKWGGFIDGIDEFDPAFFKLTPKDAEYLDPQERLFLENAYHTFEDAGYTQEELSKHKVGVYVGVMYSQYQLLAAEESLKGNNITLGANYASIANRVSYYFDLNGPSMAVDTMCSSSLTAIHLACESILKGESEMALAGGVNVTIHPDKYVFLSAHRFASSEGKCRAFGSGGDGYVPGEGVGAVLLKPLSKAIEDGNQIYAVIKGSAMGHGGKASGYTVPNPAAQGCVISDAIKESGINPETINYIEAHGTGTSLGDPVEIAGLTTAFGHSTNHSGYCAIGSVKSNIGHAEGAAGIAALTKVVLQMKYGKLVPSIHSDVLNPMINFDKTPFYVQRTLSDWKCVEETVNGKVHTCPRRAGVSSFGAGGSNVHIILEEYKNDMDNLPVEDEKKPEIIVLSAMNEDRLRELAVNAVTFLNNGMQTEIETAEETTAVQNVDNMREVLLKMIEQICGLPEGSVTEENSFEEIGCSLVDIKQLSEQMSSRFHECYSEEELLRCNTIGDILKKKTSIQIVKKPVVVRTVKQISLRNLAYTLQVGRNAMQERLAFVAHSIEEVIEKLNAFIHNTKKSDIYYGRSKDREMNSLLIDDIEGEVYFKAIVENKKYDKLARLWALGIDFDWNILYKGLSREECPRRISIFKYPFAKERYWVPNREESTKNTYIGRKISPILDRNESELGQVIFRKTFTNKDIDRCFIDGENGCKLPQSIMLSMVMEAAKLADSSQKLYSIEHVKWNLTNQKFTFPFDLVIHIYDDEDGIFFEIGQDTADNEEFLVFMDGELYYEEEYADCTELVNMDELKNELTKCKSIEHFYKHFFTEEQQLASILESIVNLYYNNEKVLIDVKKSDTRYVLNPSLLQSVMDTVTVEKEYDAVEKFEQMDIYDYTEDIQYVLLSKEDKVYNIDFMDADGSIAASIRGAEFFFMQGGLEDKTVKDKEYNKLLMLLNKLKTQELSVDEVEQHLEV